MINLLPPNEKEILLLENRKKLIAILGLTIIIPLICFMLFLLSINLYLLTELNSQKIILEQAQAKYQTADFLAFKEILEKNNTILVRLQSSYQQETTVSNVLKIITDINRPENLYLTDLSAIRDKDTNMVKVTASGFSESRDDLIVFQKNLQENEKIKNLYFSPTSWVSPQNVRFYLTLEVPKL